MLIMDKEKIGLFIAKLRKDKKLTQEQLAERLYVDRGTISKWERGIYIPNPEMLGILSKEFDVSVNEILAGEMKTKENSQVVDNVAIEIIKDSNKKFKKIFISFTTILTSLLLGFLLYYFFNTYNSISIYRINGAKEGLYIEEGIMIVSREKAYIKLGNIVSHSAEEIQSIRLYYLINDKEYNIFTGTDTDDLLINIFGYDELFSYDDLSFIKSDLYLEIVDSEGNQKVKLEMQRDFSNINLFSKKKEFISTNEKNNLNNGIPSYILDNFEYNELERYYYLDDKRKDKEINKKYLVDANVLIIDVYDNGLLEHWEYSTTSHLLSYYKMNDEMIEDSFTYDNSKNECVEGKCDQDKVDYFSNNFLEYID